MANQAFLELCNKVYTHTATEVERNEFEEAMKVIMAKGSSPQSLWEMNEIIVKQANAIIKPKLNFLNYIADVQHVNDGQKIKFQKNKGKMKFKWSARGTGVDYVRVGYQEEFTSEPVKLQAGAYYDLDQFKSGSTTAFVGVVDKLVEDMESKILAKSITTLTTAMGSAPSANRWSGSGIALTNFNAVTSTIQRYSPSVSAICDIDFAKKLTGLVGDSAMSDAMKDFKNGNGYFTKINGVDIIVYTNPFEDETNAKLVAPRQYSYVLPAGANKPVKIGFEGDMYQLSDFDIESERVFLKVGQKLGVDVFDTYYIGELNDTSLA